MYSVIFHVTYVQPPMPSQYLLTIGRRSSRVCDWKEGQGTLLPTGLLARDGALGGGGAARVRLLKPALPGPSVVRPEVALWVPEEI